MAILFHSILTDYIPKEAGSREAPDGCVRPYRPLSGLLFIGGCHERKNFVAEKF